eukprot:3443204-Prymnesium_polylepis.1
MRSDVLVAMAAAGCVPCRAARARAPTTCTWRCGLSSRTKPTSLTPSRSCCIVGMPERDLRGAGGVRAGGWCACGWVVCVWVRVVWVWVR